MLKVLRKKERAKKIIFWILVIGSVLAFVLWGTGIYRQSSKLPTYAGVIFKRKVPFSEYRNARASCLMNVRLRFGENYEKILPYINIDNQTWIRLILLEYAKKSQIKASDKEVIEAIAANPLFFKDNAFNNETYKRIIRYYLNTQPRDFEEQTRQDLIIKKLYEQLTKDISVTGEELQEAYKKEFEEAGINYIKLSADDLKKELAVTDDEIKDYFEKNLNQFKRPQTVKIEYIGMVYPPNATDEDRRKIFDQVGYSYPQIKNSKELKPLAKEPFIYKETGFFAADEPIPGIGFQSVFNLQAFSLKEKETSPVIQAPTGVYVLRVIQKKEPYMPGLEEVKEGVRNYLLTNKAREETKKRIQDYKNRIEENIKNDSSFNLKKAAELLGLQMKSPPLFTRQNPPPEFAVSKELIDAAFGLKPNQISNAIETRVGYFLIEQAQFKGIDTGKFEKEKEAYLQKVLEQKKESFLNNLINDLMVKSELKNYIGSSQAQE